MIKIILKKRITHLGMAGDVINVKSGYARNYLLPFGYAVTIKKGDENNFKHHQKILQKRIDEEKNEFLNLKKELDKVSLKFTKKTIEGQKKIFGAITALEILEALNQKNLKVEKKFISLKKPIKEIGSYVCDIFLSKDISAQIKIEVEALPEESEKEEKKVAKRKITKKVSSKTTEA